MHARKVSRLDDGCYDHNKLHLMELNDSHSKYDRYASKKRDIPDIDSFRGRSPLLQSSPRYSSKAGRGERKSEKDRSATNQRMDNNHQNNHGDIRNKDQKLKDHKAQVHKLAEKVCGDWSEHVSSSGKRYFYNCKSEVSQWERPENWVDVSVMSSSSRVPTPKDTSEKLASASHKGQRDWSKHSGSDKNSSKSTSLSGSQRRLTFGLNDSKSDALVDGGSQNHRTDVAAVANSSNRSRRSGTAPSSKTSIDSSATAVSGGPTPANCHSSELNFTGRVTCGDVGAAMSPPNHSVGTPVNPGGIYGPVVSSGCATNSDDLHQLPQPDRIDDFGIAGGTKSDDMDISPESTPTEESSLQGLASVKASSATAGTPVSTPRSLERSELLTPSAGLTPASTPSSSVQDKAAIAATSSTSVCNQTALATLAALQQAVSQVTVDKTPAAPGSTGVQRAQTSSILSCLALLPALISQLNTDRLANSQMRPQERHQNEQITKQAIEMLQKLQQALVAQQQQQQQQRQLQQLLLQLVSVQKGGCRPPVSSSSQRTTPPPSKQIRLDSSNALDAALESPYSPPDSDGTPLEATDAQPHLQSATAQISDDNNLRLDAVKTSEMDATPTRHPSPVPASAVLVTLVANQPATAAMLRKQDTTGLMPSLAKYFNSRLIEHVTGWQVDVTERHADSFAEESRSIARIHCTRVAVELKRARSLVRANEIQSTLQEQRIMFLHQRYLELEQSQSLFMPQDT